MIVKNSNNWVLKRCMSYLFETHNFVVGFVDIHTVTSFHRQSICGEIIHMMWLWSTKTHTKTSRGYKVYYYEDAFSHFSFHMDSCNANTSKQAKDTCYDVICPHVKHGRDTQFQIRHTSQVSLWHLLTRVEHKRGHTISLKSDITGDFACLHVWLYSCISTIYSITCIIGLKPCVTTQKPFCHQTCVRNLYCTIRVYTHVNRHVFSRHTGIRIHSSLLLCYYWYIQNT